ncbi:hypothetical protein [Mycobacterium botniense]|uniref:Uncharacterized protein n=1 Tax=Mycobacterium botniense TaxID=84962 RepID=A0A7I9Y101_9MYCO|nr:hypothetical protein [Mycobacterium botniense]GFG75724.1 hypothetical protein MBOT_30890 [Mycobacterium botniense]
MTIDPEHIRAHIEAVLAELPEISDTKAELNDLDEIASRLSAAHDVLVQALEKAEKG